MRLPGPRRVRSSGWSKGEARHRAAAKKPHLHGCDLIFAAAGAVIKSGPRSRPPESAAPISLRPQKDPEVGANIYSYRDLWQYGGTSVALATGYFGLLPLGHIVPDITPSLVSLQFTNMRSSGRDI